MFCLILIHVSIDRYLINYYNILCVNISYFNDKLFIFRTSVDLLRWPHLWSYMEEADGIGFSLVI